jgi:hypothetical protein
VADLVSEQPLAAPAEAPQPLARPRPEPRVPRHRFGIAYLILALILGVAVALFVVLVLEGGKDSEPAWSAWKPKQEGVRKLNEIAKHVEGQYAQADGRKLVLVLSTPPEVQGQGQPVPLRAIGVSSGLPGETSKDASFYDASASWAYNFCGLGSKCALPGKASPARYTLLRREALELSLYTLKYEPRIQSVVTYMPPAVNTGSGSTASTAIFLRRQDLAPALKAPLARTLAPIDRSLRPGRMRPEDRKQVARYTGDRIYQYSFQQLQDGTPVLALVPLAG